MSLVLGYQYCSGRCELINGSTDNGLERKKVAGCSTASTSKRIVRRSGLHDESACGDMTDYVRQVEVMDSTVEPS